MTTCRSEKYFSEPEKFIPERWIGEEKNKLNAFAMIPFGFGNRMCAGRRFAQLHIEMAVVSIIREFELSIDTCDQIELICNFLIVPNRQIKLKFNKRI
jgi:cytochrome P450